MRYNNIFYIVEYRYNKKLFPKDIDLIIKTPLNYTEINCAIAYLQLIHAKFIPINPPMLSKLPPILVTQMLNNFYPDFSKHINEIDELKNHEYSCISLEENWDKYCINSYIEYQNTINYFSKDNIIKDMLDFMYTERLATQYFSFLETQKEASVQDRDVLHRISLVIERGTYSAEDKLFNRKKELLTQNIIE